MNKTGVYIIEYYPAMKRNELFDTCNNMSASQNNCVEWKKADKKKYIYCMILFI